MLNPGGTVSVRRGLPWNVSEGGEGGVTSSPPRLRTKPQSGGSQPSPRSLPSLLSLLSLRPRLAVPLSHTAVDCQVLWGQPIVNPGGGFRRPLAAEESGAGLPARRCFGFRPRARMDAVEGKRCIPVPDSKPRATSGPSVAYYIQAQDGAGASFLAQEWRGSRPAQSSISAPRPPAGGIINGVD